MEDLPFKSYFTELIPLITLDNFRDFPQSFCTCVHLLISTCIFSVLCFVFLFVLFSFLFLFLFVCLFVFSNKKIIINDRKKERKQEESPKKKTTIRQGETTRGTSALGKLRTS